MIALLDANIRCVSNLMTEVRDARLRPSLSRTETDKLSRRFEGGALRRNLKPPPAKPIEPSFHKRRLVGLSFVFPCQQVAHWDILVSAPIPAYSLFAKRSSSFQVLEFKLLETLCDTSQTEEATIFPSVSVYFTAT